MIQTVILGTGNVAKHLFDAFSLTETIKVVQVVGRNREELDYFGNIAADYGAIADADAYIISVSDSAISSVSRLLNKKKGLVVHTSGSVSLKVLSPNKAIGVLYPLQTFSKNRKVNFKTVPICIESNSPDHLILLEEMGGSISGKVFKISSAERRVLHVAAVFANNFTNHMYHIANEICEEHQLSFDILRPLIQETAIKIQENRPYDMQTGPARRHDQETLKNHLLLLKNKERKKMYTLLTESIEKQYGEKL